MMKYVIIFFAIKYKNNFKSIYDAIKNKEYISPEEILKIKKKLSARTIKAITIIDDDYPKLLKSINKPPFIIYYETKSNKLNRMDTINYINQEIEKIGLENQELIWDFINSMLPGTYSSKQSITVTGYSV